MGRFARPHGATALRAARSRRSAPSGPGAGGAGGPAPQPGGRASPPRRPPRRTQASARVSSVDLYVNHPPEGPAGQRLVAEWGRVGRELRAFRPLVGARARAVGFSGGASLVDSRGGKCNESRTGGRTT